MYDSIDDMMMESNLIDNFLEYAKVHHDFTDCLIYYLYLRTKEMDIGLTDGEASMLYGSVHNCNDELFRAFNLDYMYAPKCAKIVCFSLEDFIMHGINEIVKISKLEDEPAANPQSILRAMREGLIESLNDVFKRTDKQIIDSEYFFGKIETSKGIVIKTLRFHYKMNYSDDELIKVITEYNSELTSRNSFYSTLLNIGLPEVMRHVSYMDIISELAKDIWFTQFKNENWKYMKCFTNLRRLFFRFAETIFYRILCFNEVYNTTSNDLRLYYMEKPYDYDKTDYSGKTNHYDDTKNNQHDMCD